MNICPNGTHYAIMLEDDGVSSVGIITFFNANNFGAVLQCYALFKQLEKEGHSAYVMDFKDPAFANSYRIFRISKNPFTTFESLVSIPTKLHRKNRFDEFRNDFFKYSKDFESLDYYVCGSDQIWNFDITKGCNPVYFGAYTPDVNKRVSYAASIGKSYINKNEEQEIGKYINQLSRISVREDEAREALSKITDKSIYVVPDPTILLEKEDWDLIISNRMENKPYLLVYSIFKDESLYRLAESISSLMGLRIVEVSLSWIKKKQKQIVYYDDVGPKEFLNLIKFSNYVVTDSFHGTVFSIIFNKQFYTIPPSQLSSRTNTLLRHVGLEYQAVKIGQHYKLDSIDYSIVNPLLKDYASSGRAFLFEAIK